MVAAVEEAREKRREELRSLRQEDERETLGGTRAGE